MGLELAVVGWARSRGICGWLTERFGGMGGCGSRGRRGRARRADWLVNMLLGGRSWEVRE